MAEAGKNHFCPSCRRRVRRRPDHDRTSTDRASGLVLEAETEAVDADDNTRPGVTVCERGRDDSRSDDDGGDTDDSDDESPDRDGSDD